MANITVYSVKIGTRLAEMEASFSTVVSTLTGKVYADTLAAIAADRVAVALDMDLYPASNPGSNIISNGFGLLAKRINEVSSLFTQATVNKVFHTSMINFDQGAYAVNTPALLNAAKATMTYGDLMEWPTPFISTDENTDLTGEAPLVIGEVDLGDTLYDRCIVQLTDQTDPLENGGYVYTVDLIDDVPTYTLTPVDRNAAAMFATGITAKTTGIAFETLSNLICVLQNIITAP